MSDFETMLAKRKTAGAYLCVGLDPTPDDFQRLGGVQKTLDWLRGVTLDASPFVAAWKPNLQFFLGEGWRGIRMLEWLIQGLRETHPGIPVILDAKWGDIGSTNVPNVNFARSLGVQAVTIHNYLGAEAMQPLLEQFYCFVLCKTSNDGSGEFQDLRLIHPFEDSLYRVVARNVDYTWGIYGPGVGLVVGATHPNQLAEVDMLVRDRVLLIPGVGAQGGTVHDVMANVVKNIPLINVSRGVTKAESPALAAKDFNEQIEEALPG